MAENPDPGFTSDLSEVIKTLERAKPMLEPVLESFERSLAKYGADPRSTFWKTRSGRNAATTSSAGCSPKPTARAAPLSPISAAVTAPFSITSRTAR